MIHRPYLLAAVFAALAVLALAVDLPVAAWFARGGLPRDLAKLFNLAEVFAHGMGVVCILATAYVLDGEKRRQLPRVIACAFGSGLLSNLVKLSAARLRPNAGPFESVWDTFAGWLPWATAESWSQGLDSRLQSFPSSHTATAAGLAIGLGLLYPRGRWLFWCFAAMAAVQRVQSGAHFPSDVLAGAALACLFSGWCADPRWLGKWFDRIERRPAD